MTILEAPVDLNLRNACRGMDPEAFMLDPNPDHTAQREALDACLDWGKQIRGIGFIWGGQAIVSERKANTRTGLIVLAPRSCKWCRRPFAPARPGRMVCSDRCARARNGYNARRP